MALFDRYLMVDWSAASQPTRGADSVWACLARREGGAVSLDEPINFPTRAAFMGWFADIAQASLRDKRRMLAGFDFAFAYPKGAAARIGGTASWTALWRAIGTAIDDADDNANNRFEVGAAFNRSAFADGAMFWGRPHQHDIADLPATQPASRGDMLSNRRLAEARAPGAQPVLKLAYAGSVGGQALTGIARLHAFRNDPAWDAVTRIWPLETGFHPFADFAPITLAEIYPSLFRADMTGEGIRDREQVQLVARKFADFDSSGSLAALMARPSDLSDEEVEIVIQEEGWILGLGHDNLPSPPSIPFPVRDSLAYERAPRAIYDASFATIRAEADLSRFPPGMDEVAIRLIHACGMVEAASEIAFTPEAYARGRAAIASGAPVFCDAEMVRHGIIRRMLPAQNDLICLINDGDVTHHAGVISNTRSAAQVDYWADRLEGAVVAIGNAPTALFRLLELVASGGPKPALVIGLPVGFVGAAESKVALAENKLGLDFITLHGRRGGSAMASAVVNALSGGLNGNG